MLVLVAVEPQIFFEVISFLTPVIAPILRIVVFLQGFICLADTSRQLEGGSVAVCRVNRGKVKLDALLPEGHTRAWQCKDVPLICQRLHVDLLDTGYPVG